MGRQTCSVGVIVYYNLYLNFIFLLRHYEPMNLRFDMVNRLPLHSRTVRILCSGFVVVLCFEVHGLFVRHNADLRDILIGRISDFPDSIKRALEQSV